ncbi:histone deacetylase [Pisolithus sp. B1]|nr:histone deacetylase [Pisolithus sp. B1]
MVIVSQATTFSSSAYFDDRGPHGTAQPITERVNPHSRPIVSYFFPKGVDDFHYGVGIPPLFRILSQLLNVAFLGTTSDEPHRLTLTNALVMGYSLDKQIHRIYSPRPATQVELEMYHDHDYVGFLSRVTSNNQNDMRHLTGTFNCVEVCPIFAELYDFCRMYAGASLADARKLCSGTCDTAINWSGNLHHAKRGEASGFCYVNDIVLAILELLRYHPRVLYIDIDIHHGDGVDLAFYHSNMVMTEHSMINGANLGKHFCLNVPLQDGTDDEMYLTVFKTVIEDTVTAFRPTAIVLQRSAGSLGCDRLGAFNLSIAAHGECINFVCKFNVPLLEIPDELHATVYDPFFRDSQWKLHPPLTGRVENLNSPASLQKITISIRNELSVRKPRSKRTRGRGRGRASGTHGKEDGEEVDEPGGPSSAKPGKTRGRMRSHVKPRCRVAEKVKGVGDVDAGVSGESESGFEPAMPVDVDVDV